MVSTKDLLLVGGIGVIAFIILKSGRDLFGALPSLAEGLGDSGAGVLDFFGNAGSGIQDFFGGVKLPGFDTIPPPPVVLGQIQDKSVPQDLIPTEVERVQGNQSILNRLGLGNAPNLVDNSRPFNLAQLAQSVMQPAPIQSPSESVGGIFDTPIRRLSLGQIIDENTGLTASQAADLKFRTEKSDFDFGTNTGSGIGSIVANLANASIIPGGNISDSRFAGLSATEIAQRLTGGNISNF